MEIGSSLYFSLFLRLEIASLRGPLILVFSSLSFGSPIKSGNNVQYAVTAIETRTLSLMFKREEPSFAFFFKSNAATRASFLTSSKDYFSRRSVKEILKTLRLVGIAKIIFYIFFYLDP